ncbi:MAG: tRNA (adenosine(37)-N6)-threonylcarbamoyltransferase complex transferase subunit TsaD [Balneolales bacterium]
MIILGIESSCDETAAAVYSDKGLLCNIVASQLEHEAFGGVVPELASRAHELIITSTVKQALDEADTRLEDIDAIAVTRGPGLLGALLVGLCFAKGLSLRIGKPVIGINHIDAHVYANFIEQKPEFPFVSLVVSGGHTQLSYVAKPFSHQLLGESRDDAAGEAFDKIGKLLGLPYPAGPQMDAMAKKGDPSAYKFPQALLHEGLDFSFSGLKTSVLYHLKDIPEGQREAYVHNNIENLCAGISHAITEVLVKKLEKAVSQTGVKAIVLAGGVSANSMLREKTKKLADENGLTLHIPKPIYCTDNAAMIAVTGYLKAQSGMYDNLHMKPFARLPRAKVQDRNGPGPMA